MTQSKNGSKNQVGISPKKTYRWLTNTWKDAQHHLLSEKCKSKPNWGTISCWSEWLLSKNLQTIYAGEGVEKREPSYTVGGNATSTATMENCMEIPLKPGNRSVIWPSNPTAGHTQETEETRIERDTCTPMFMQQCMHLTAALFTIAGTWKQPRCPSADEWIRKLWYIYTMEYFSAIKRMHLN